jgi:hypothetical protein
MRKLNPRSIAWLALPLAVLALDGCKRKQSAAPAPEATIEESGELASVVHTADPKTASQLLKGFYPVEGNAWRWTKQKFSVTLRPPANAPTAGAILELKFAVPDSVLASLTSFKLSAKVNGTALPPATYAKSGAQTYSQDVPASALKGDAATVEFEMDKAVPPGAVDQRELGVVVASVGFEAK